MITDAQLADAARRIARRRSEILLVVDGYRTRRDLAWALMPRLGKLEAVRHAMLQSEQGLRLDDFQSFVELLAACRQIRRQYPRAYREINRLLGPQL